MEQEEKYFLSERAREDLENLEGYIEEFSVFLPLAVFTLNPSGIIVDINQAAKDLSGYDEASIIGQGIEFLFEDKDLAEKFFSRILKQRKAKGQEMVLVTRTKKRVPVNVSGAERKDRQGNIMGCFLAVTDITEIKKSQEGLEEKVIARTKELDEARQALVKTLEEAQEAKRIIEEERNKTRAALTSLTDGLVVFDREKKISLINPEAERILGAKEEDLLGKKIEEVVDLPNLARLYQVLDQKIEWTGQKYELVLKEPFRRFFQVSIAPVAVEKEIVGLMIILHDISREKEVDRLKTEFVSIAAHQLRTPLSAIKWSLRLLLDGDVGEVSKEQRGLLEKSYNSNERMITLINDLLNVARIEEGRFIFNPTMQSLVKIIEKAISNLSEAIRARKLKVVFKKPKTPLPKLRVDEEKMSLVIQNLLDNAVRFNKPEGQIIISIKAGKKDIEVIIKDTGIGIPKAQQERIFAKFFRADNAIKSETEGTGLGLFICKNIIEAHGGKIWFESKEDKGSTFYFTLPLK